MLTSDQQVGERVSIGGGLVLAIRILGRVASIRSEIGRLQIRMGESHLRRD